jgi:hypothetical protein
MTVVARLAEVTFTVRESEPKPGLLTVMECCPGGRLVSTNGVT